MSALRITKMSGAGNDFVVLGAEAAAALGGRLAAWTRAICRRGLSVGADGVLIVTPAGPDRVRLVFLNPDGSEAFCGNGTRCAARYALLHGLSGARLTVQTVAGEVPAEIVDGAVRLTLPLPEDRGPLVLDAPGGPVEGRLVWAGTPHFVVAVAAVDAWPLSERAPGLRRHAAFEDAGANITIVEEAGADTLRIRTWEKGVESETLACGSGAVAAGFVALGSRRSRLRILPASGIALFVDRRRHADRLEFEGDARVIFDGHLGPDAEAGGYRS